MPSLNGSYLRLSRPVKVRFAALCSTNEDLYFDVHTIYDYSLDFHLTLCGPPPYESTGLLDMC